MCKSLFVALACGCGWAGCVVHLCQTAPSLTPLNTLYPTGCIHLFASRHSLNRFKGMRACRYLLVGGIVRVYWRVLLVWLYLQDNEISHISYSYVLAYPPPSLSLAGGSVGGHAAFWCVFAIWGGVESLPDVYRAALSLYSHVDMGSSRCIGGA